MKLFAWRQDSTGDIVVTYGADVYSATLALCTEYPDEEAGDFNLIAVGEPEFIENILNAEFGGIAVLRDTSEV